MCLCAKSDTKNEHQAIEPPMRTKIDSAKLIQFFFISLFTSFANRVLNVSVWTHEH